jgi:23S rRNA-/tRNA-specific pseudouridylate synthase
MIAITIIRNIFLLDIVLVLTTVILLVSLPIVNGFLAVRFVQEQSAININFHKIITGTENSIIYNNDYYCRTSSLPSTFLLAKPRPIDLSTLNDIEAFEKKLFQTDNNERDIDDDVSDIDEDDDYFESIAENQRISEIDTFKKLMDGKLVTIHPISDLLDSIRIDSALATVIASCQFPIDISRVQSTQFLEAECVSIDDNVVTRKAMKVQNGQLLRIDWKKVFSKSLLGDRYSFSSYEVLPENIPLDILYEDDAILVINKQSNMVVHPGAGNWNGTIVNAVAYYLQNKSPYIPSELFCSSSNITTVNLSNNVTKRPGIFRDSALTINEKDDASEEQARVEDSKKASSCNVLELVRRLMEQQQQIQDQSSFRPGIIHRLDKGTTGVMVIGKTAQAVRDISNQFATRSKTRTTSDSSESLRHTIDLLLEDKDRTTSTYEEKAKPTTTASSVTPVKKLYLACTVGKNPGNSVVLNKPIRRHRTNRQQMCVIQSHDPDDTYYDFDDGQPSSGKEALSVVDTIQYNSKNQIAFVQVQIYTGRTHQIRVHLQDFSIPIIGDDVYGNKVYNERYFSPEASFTKSINSGTATIRTTKKLTKTQRQEQRRSNRLNRRPYLHAHQLTLTHPITDQIMRFVAPLPHDMMQFVNKYSLLPEEY